MRYIRLKLSSVLLLGLVLTGLQAQTIILKDNAGQQTLYNLSSIEKMSFLSGNVLIKKTGSSSNVYGLSAIRYLVFSDVTTRIEKQLDLNNETKANLYPNPADNYFTLKLSEGAALNNKVDILNLHGQVVQSNQITGSHTSIDIQGLNKGVYFCRYTKEGKSQTIKFIKQ